MKTVCPHCGKEIEYEADNFPKMCPYCNSRSLIVPKTEEEKARELSRCKLPPRLMNIPHSTQKRRFLIIPLAVFDLGIIALGVYLATHFTIFTHSLTRYLVWLGVLIAFIGLYRIVYHLNMGFMARHAIIRHNVRSVRELIPALRLKTQTDVLLVLKREIKYGFLCGFEVKNGEEIIEVYPHTKGKQ